MRLILAILFRCILALGLGFTPVANALSMAAPAAHAKDAPPCHAPCHDEQKPAGKCCGSANPCHCAMATALPATLPSFASPAGLADHPQTVRRFALEQSTIPDTPPPRLIS